MCDYPFFIPQVVLFANSSLFWFKVTNEHREFRNYLSFIINDIGVKRYFDFNISLHFSSICAIMSGKRGACREQAENRLYRLDPKPDLDNANVGIYRMPIKSFHLDFLFDIRQVEKVPARYLLFCCHLSSGKTGGYYEPK